MSEELLGSRKVSATEISQLVR